MTPVPASVRSIPAERHSQYFRNDQRRSGLIHRIKADDVPTVRFEGWIIGNLVDGRGVTRRSSLTTNARTEMAVDRLLIHVPLQVDMMPVSRVTNENIMNLQFRKAIIPAELRSLVIFDRKAFSQHPGDSFRRDDWLAYECWWMLIDDRKIGCCAFEPNVDFQDDLRDDGENPALDGSLYIASTGILREFRGNGLGSLMKCWQISYARFHGYERIVANTRKSNKAMIGLNKKFGFKVTRTTPSYYDDPPEATVVMERRIGTRT